MKAAAIFLLAGCGGVRPAAEPAKPPLVRSHRSEKTFDASTLGEPGIDASFTRHAYLAREGEMRLAREGEAIHVSSPRELPALEPFPVVGEAPDVVRIVEEYDGARIAIWIERETLAPTVTTASELLDQIGAAGDGTHGVWLAAGTQITAAAAEHHSALRTITTSVPDLDVTGKLPAAVVSEIWTGPVPAPFDPETTRDHHFVVATTRIYAAAADESRVLATTTEQTTATQLAAIGTWAEIEIHRDGLRLRGFVHTDALTKIDYVPGFGHGGMHGRFAMSDTDRFEVPAGTCLYDHDAGTVVGVMLATQERDGYLRNDTPWSHVFIGTDHWRQPLLTILRAGDSWESCVAK